MEAYMNKEIIGYIKFVDEKYVTTFDCLSSLWLSSIDVFTKEPESSKNNLIDDRYEGRLKDLVLNMPAFITCFTELENDNFEKDGTLKEKFSKLLLENEEQLGKNRKFIFIPTQNMSHLLQTLDSANRADTKEGVLNDTEFFSRKIEYCKNYEDKMKALEDDFFAGNVSKEKLASKMLATKDSKYSAQNEFRIGIVLPCKKEDVASDHISLKITSPFPFATKSFEKSQLKTLNTQELK